MVVALKRAGFPQEGALDCGACSYPVKQSPLEVPGRPRMRPGMPLPSPAPLRPPADRHPQAAAGWSLPGLGAFKTGGFRWWQQGGRGTR